MNRALLTFSAMLLASASMAQVGKVAPTLQVPTYKEAVARMTAKPLASVSTTKAKSPVARAASNGLADNQHYMGPYYSDKYETEVDNGLGFGAGTFKVGTFIDYPQAVKFNGGKIVAIRYALCGDITSPSVFVNTISNKDGNAQIGDEVISQAGGTPERGWNTVKLDNPYTINVDGTDVAAFIIGLQFTQVADAYPISTVTFNTNPTIYVYGSGTEGEKWYSLNNYNYGSLSVQCIVEKDGGFHVVDAMLSDLRAPRYIQSGGKTTLGFTCTSFSDDITSAQFGVKLNGTEVAELNYDDTITTDGADLTVTIDTPDTLTIGKVGNLSLYVKKLNGEAPTDVNSMQDDEVSTSFVPYTTSFSRQKQLVEFFTSQAGKYCTYGDNVLAELSKLRDDLVKVGVHASLTSGTDSWALDESAALISFSASSVPSASFNRYYCNSIYNSANRIAIATDYDSYTASVAKLLSNNVIDGSNYDYPAFATVDLATTYDSDTRKLNIKVYGQNVSDFKKVMGDDAVLTVYLTQDSQKGNQIVGTSEVYNYENNDVLRMFVSGELGDAISWDGTSYEKNYEVTIPENISITKKKVMHVVAFISRPIKYSDSTFTTSITDAWVTNANTCQIGESTTSAIKQGLVDVEDVHEVARYSLDGMLLSAPVKGVNIVKYSNGKTAKVVVE